MQSEQTMRQPGHSLLAADLEVLGRPLLGTLACLPVRKTSFWWPLGVLLRCAVLVQG